MTDKESIADNLALSLGTTAFSAMGECGRYGMTLGCDKDCPALNKGKCEVYEDVDDYIRKEMI